MAAPYDPVKSVVESLYKPIESIVKTIAGPAAQELALLFQDTVKEYRLRRWVRCFKRTQTLFAESGIKPQAVKPMLLYEILDGASLEDDDNLQDMWANLLANAADSREEVLVRTAFPQILRQISREEATYLTEMYDITQKATGWAIRSFPHESEQENQEHPPKLDPISYDNLKRLRLVVENDETVPVEDLKAGFNQYKFLTHEYHSLTDLGSAFVKACQQPKPVRRE